MPDDATQKWLQPLMTEAAKRGVTGKQFAFIMMKGAMSTAEPDDHAVDKINPTNPDAEVKFEAMDWLRVGQLLREELGWDTYPERSGS